MSLQINPPPSFLSLPNEIILTCLARISRSYYPKLSLVSKTFRSLLSSTELYTARSHLKRTEHCLYVCLWDSMNQTSEWFRLLANPHQTLPNSSMIKTEKTSGQFLVPIPSSNFNAMSQSTIVFGSDIYLIGGCFEGKPSSTVKILDCRTHTWRNGPSMKAARQNASSCVHNGKIYVFKGCREGSWAEVFDTKTQTWECLPDPGVEIRKLIFHKIQEMEGKITFQSTDNMYAYDTKQGKWECCGNAKATFFGSECVIENVSYSFRVISDFMYQWYDINEGNWKDVKGLDSLRHKIKWSGLILSSTRNLVCCGGKLLFIWEGYRNKSVEICCTEIKVEKRDGGEVWGKIEGVVVHTIPGLRWLLHCLVVSV